MEFWTAQDVFGGGAPPALTRGALGRPGTFERLRGHANLPNLLSFVYSQLERSIIGGTGAGVQEVAGTGYTFTEFIKAIVWFLRKHLSEYEEHKLQQADLEDQNAAQATITQQSLAQLRDIAQQLVTEQKALRAELTATRSESVHGAMLATLSAELANVALRVDSLQEASVDCSGALIAVRAELTATRSDVNVALLPFAHCHGASQSTEEFAGRLATVESAAVRLQEAAARDQHEHGRVVTRVEQESARTLQVIHRVTDLESGSLAALWRLARLERGDEPDPTD
jgi:hypothetical protein